MHAFAGIAAIVLGVISLVRDGRAGRDVLDGAAWCKGAQNHFNLTIHRELAFLEGLPPIYGARHQ
jgi:hypothetical protein